MPGVLNADLCTCYNSYRYFQSEAFASRGKRFLLQREVGAALTKPKFKVALTRAQFSEASWSIFLQGETNAKGLRICLKHWNPENWIWILPVTKSDTIDDTHQERRCF